MSRGRSGLLSLSPGTTPCQCAMSSVGALSTRTRSGHGSRRQTRLRQTLGRAAPRAEVVTASTALADVRGAGPDRTSRSQPRRWQRDGDNGGSAPRRSAHGSCGHLSAGRGRGSHRKGSARIRARAGVLDDATYRRERLTERRLLLSTTAAARHEAAMRRRRSAARAEGVSPFPDQFASN
jgi:hypothetical protein